MTASKLTTRLVPKPWGRTSLPAGFPDAGGDRIGELWFEGPSDRHPPLLVKYIFTSEKLSIQVHPNDQQARARGLPGGKSECWYILDAEPDARLGIGLTRDLTSDELRAAAIDGSIEGLIDWKPVSAGSFFYIPAGTVHAIGGGVSLIEVQQNNDVTYRLYDYGRPRELHLEDGVNVSRPHPYPMPNRAAYLGDDVTLLEERSAPFSLELVHWQAGERLTMGDDATWFIPISGTGMIDTAPWQPSQCWLIENGSTINVETNADVLIASI